MLLAAAASAALAGCSSSTPEPPPAAAPPTGPPSVRYLGPGSLSGPSSLRARAAAASGRIVAVTFLLDGRPLGSDTTPPYALDVEPALLRPGDHRLRVEAVDNLGRRTTSQARSLKVERGAGRVLEASPVTFGRAREALRAGGVTVRLAPGRYFVGQLRLGTGARLVGSGPETVLAAHPGAYWAVVVARGEGIRISDLTIDGGGPGPGSDDGGIGVAVFDGSSDVRLQRLQFVRVRTHGVNVWGANSDVSVQDSTFEGAGTAQAAVLSLGSDRSRDTSAIRNRIHGFRSYGILLGQKAFDRPTAALHGLALDNDIRDIRDPARDRCVYDTRNTPRCGTNEGGIWTGGVEAAIVGNTVVRARWDGIETVGSSTRTTIVRNVIRNTRTGIYLEHSTRRSIIARNLIANAEAGINVEWFHEGQGSSHNTFESNRFENTSDAGLFVDVGGDGNRIVGNVFIGGARPAITLQGSSNNVVQDNLGCDGRGGSLVEMQSANYDDGTPAHSRANRLAGNRAVKTC